MAVTDVSAPDAAASAPEPAPQPVPGQLTSVWRVVIVMAWVAVALAWSAVWSASVQLGTPTWWLGTRASPSSPLVRLFPYLGPVVIVAGAIANARRLAWLGIAAALVFAGYAFGDVADGLGRLAWIELGVAVAALVASLAALSGTYRASNGPVASHA